MNVFSKLFPKVPVQKAAKTYGPNDLWLRGIDSQQSTEGGAFVKSAFENSAVAYACIRRQAMDAAGVPLKFLSRPDDDTAEVADSDPVKRLFARPNQVMSTARLIEWSVMLQCLRGEWFWVFDDPARPTEVYPWFDPINWQEQVTADAGLVAWKCAVSGNVKVHLAGEVLHYCDANPANPYRGLSPLQAVRYSVDVDVYGDQLGADTMRTGGERPLIFSLPENVFIDDDKYEQIRSRLMARLPRSGGKGGPFIAEGGMKLENPALLESDLDVLASMGAARKRICFAYGMAPVLIGDDDSAQYKSAPEAIKLYWNQTLAPKLHAIEDAWDQYFVGRRGLRTYVRFDLSKVSALQQAEQEKAAVARIYATMGIPLVAINEHLGLGFDESVMQAADEAQAARDAAFEFDPTVDAVPAPKAADAGPAHTLTKSTIKARADRIRIDTNRRRMRLEAKTESGLRHVAGQYKAKVDAIIEDVLASSLDTNGAAAVTRRINELAQPMGEDLLKVIDPAHVEAAAVGVASIQELVDGKAIDYATRRKAVSFTPAARDIMERRGRHIARTLPRVLFENINDRVHTAVAEAVEAGESVGYVQAAIRDMFNQFGNSQARTIARTEVGTLYNTARAEEMREQGYEKHEWVTSLDEATRPAHAEADGEVRRIGERFSTGLEYPLQDGGEPEDVINCRCETIPVVED